MTDNEKTLTQFEIKVRSLISAYEDAALERSMLQEQVDVLTTQVKTLELELKQSKNDYEALKTARMLAVAEGDQQAARKKVDQAIKSVDRCLALLMAAE